MKILCVHAHFDDYEFVAGGTFELWKRKLGGELRARVLVCTDGKAGHHFRTREETGALRQREQMKSAEIGGYELEVLRLPNGEIPREACLQVSVPLLAALWKSIRDFEPDYLFCPPIPADPLAGIHVDHVAVAEAVRKVTYMINVPHAFTLEYPADETQSKPCKTPVVVNLYDAYMTGANTYHLAVDAEAAYDTISQMTYCHQSQIAEWLPWVDRHQMSKPDSFDGWKKVLRDRYKRQNSELGVPTDHAMEFFTVTAWGRVPRFGQVIEDFPGLSLAHSNTELLKRQLSAWLGEFSERNP